MYNNRAIRDPIHKAFVRKFRIHAAWVSDFLFFVFLNFCFFNFFFSECIILSSSVVTMVPETLLYTLLLLNTVPFLCSPTVRSLFAHFIVYMLFCTLSSDCGHRSQSVQRSSTVRSVCDQRKFSLTVQFFFSSSSKFGTSKRKGHNKNIEKLNATKNLDKCECYIMYFYEESIIFPSWYCPTFRITT